MMIKPRGNCCHCPPWNPLGWEPDCNQHQSLIYANVCCSTDAKGQPQWQAQVHLLCAKKNWDCTVNDPDDAPTPVAGGGHYDDDGNYWGFVPLDGPCKPTRLVNSEPSVMLPLQWRDRWGDNFDPDFLCPVTVRVFRPGGGNAMLFDPGGQNLVDSSGLKLS